MIYIKVDCCALSSTGLQDIDANDIIADNITILSNLNVSGTTNLNNSLNVQGVINNSNNIINNDSSTININASNRIIFLDKYNYWYKFYNRGGWCSCYSR
jgi:hypothetical protein